MKTRQKRKYLFILVFGVLLLTSVSLACGSTTAFDDPVEDAGTTSTTTSTSNKTFTGETEQQIDTLDVSSEAKVVDLRIKSNLRSGEMSWVLTDPTGSIRWEERLEGATVYSESRRYDAVTGEWTLQIDIVGATGSYDISWEARD